MLYLDYTEILHGFEESPPMSMPDMLVLKVVELEGAMLVMLGDILAIITIVSLSEVLYVCGNRTKIFLPTADY